VTRRVGQAVSPAVYDLCTLPAGETACPTRVNQYGNLFHGANFQGANIAPSVSAGTGFAGETYPALTLRAM